MYNATSKDFFSLFERRLRKMEEAFTLQLLIVGVLCYILGVLGCKLSAPFPIAIMLFSAYFVFKQTAKKEVTKVVREVLYEEDLWHNNDFVKLALNEMPSWIKSGDWEESRFVQKAVEQAWPAARKLIDVMMRTYVDPILKTVKPKFLNSLVLREINLGSKCPEVRGVQNLGSGNVEEIILAVELAIQPANISLYVKACSGVGLSVGLRDIRIAGTLRMVFAPLIGDVPFIGGFRIGFLKRPDIDFELQAGGMGLKVIPGLEDFLENLVQNLIEQYFCWPNDIFVPIIEVEDRSGVERQPVGLLKITPLRARGLERTSKIPKKPDPYCLITIDGKGQKTIRANNTLEPVWSDKPMEFIIMDLKNCYADIVVYNARKLKKDTILGSCKISFSEGDWKLGNERLVCTKWVKLQRTTSGEILLKIDWRGSTKDNSIKQNFLCKTPNLKPSVKTGLLAPESEAALEANSFIRIMENLQVKQKIVNTDGDEWSGTYFQHEQYEHGLLVLRVKSAEGLKSADSDGLSDPYVIIELSTPWMKYKHPQTTKVKKNTLQPCWDEEFTLRIFDCEKSIVKLTVKDYDQIFRDDTLGVLCLPVIDIVKNNCRVDAWYPLQKGRGKIHISSHYTNLN